MSSVFVYFIFGGWFRQIILASIVTVLLALGAYLIGIFVSLSITIAKMYKVPGIYTISVIYTTLFRCIPEILIIFFFFHTFTNFGRSMNSIFTINIANGVISVVSAVVSLGLISGSYLTEIFRGGVSAISPGQTEAADALGMAKSTVVWRIVVPQLIKYTWKPATNVWLVTLKDTALVAIIGISELMYKTNLCVTSTGQPFLFYGFAAIMYLAMLVISRLILRFLSYKYNYLLKYN